MQRVVKYAAFVGKKDCIGGTNQMPYSNNEAIDQEISHLRKFNSSVMVSKDIRERIKEINTLFKRYENNEIAKDYLKKTLELQLINIDHKLEMNSFAWMNSFLLRLVK